MVGFHTIQSRVATSIARTRPRNVRTLQTTERHYAALSDKLITGENPRLYRLLEWAFNVLYKQVDEQ